MPRIRTIKPEFFRHIGLAEAEQKTGLPLRLAFIGLWTVADREGRFVWEPRNLKLDVMPHDQVDFAKIMDALAQIDSIVRYEVGGKAYGCIPSWTKHQIVNVRESESKIPEAGASMCKHVHAHGELEREREREKEREGRVELEQGFDQFWKLYPRKVSKAKAMLAWKKLKTEEQTQAIEAIPSHTKQDAWKKDNGKYIPHPTTWLNGRRWEDDLGPIKFKPVCPHPAEQIRDGRCMRCGGVV